MSRMKSRYLELFKALAAEKKDLYQLRGDCCFVEEVPFEEKKTKSGIILEGHKRAVDGFDQNRPTLVHILAVGEGYYDEKTDETIPVGVKPGDIVLTGTTSIKWLSYFGPIISAEGARIGMIRDEDVQHVYQGEGSYEEIYAFMEAYLNKGAA